MSKTIAFFLSDLQSGGTEWFAYRLAQGLAAKNLTPIFLVTEKIGALLPVVSRDFEVYVLHGSGYSPMSMVKTFLPLVRFLRERNPDILFSGLPLLNLTAGLALKVAHSHSDLVLVEHMRLKSPRHFSPWRLIRQFAKRLSIACSHLMTNKVVYVSQTVEQDFIECGLCSSKKGTLIYNPIIPPDFDVLYSQLAEHPWMSTPVGPIIISVGRLLPIKDHATLIRAFAGVVAHSPQARLIIFGEGPEKETLQKLISTLGLSDQISLPGTTQNIFSAMKAADLFVLPSRSEAFGNVLIEAMACGTKIVSTDCGGPREILEDGKWGTLIPIGDEDAMAQAILHALKTPCDKKGLMQRGQIFSVTAATQAYLSLLGL